MSHPELTRESFNPAVDRIANHAGKMVCLLILAESPDTAFSSQELDKDIMLHQGNDPGWVLPESRSGIPFSYCKRSLAPLLVDETTISTRSRSRTATAYQINEYGQEIGTPLCGAVLGWELEHPEISASRILGHSNSVNHTGRMPSTRRGVYDQLLASPEGMSVIQLQTALGVPKERVSKIVSSLRTMGIVEVLELFHPSQRTVTLHEPDYPSARLNNSRIHGEIRAIYATTRELLDESKTTMTGQEFLDEVTAKFPHYDPHTVWKRLMRARNRGMNFVQLAPVKNDGKQQTTVTLTPGYREPVTDLVKAFDRLETDTAYRNDMLQQAHEIISEPELVATLLAKARRNSAHVNSLTRTQWRGHILKNIPAEGIDARSLYISVTAEAPQISYTTFRDILAEHCGDGYEIACEEARGRMGRPIGWVQPSSRNPKTENEPSAV